MAIRIKADFRENPSGIPRLLAGHGDVCLTTSSLPAGDYIISGTIGIERKTAEDFVQSIVNNRLFEQIARLKKSVTRPLLIIEGSPYGTAHAIHAHAIRGALLSVLLAWQVPVILSKNKEDTVALLLMAARQEMSSLSPFTGPRRYRHKKSKNQQLLFLQGIPAVGPVLAGRLLRKFGNLKAVINATEAELRKIEGISKPKAMKICRFIAGQITSG